MDVADGNIPFASLADEFLPIGLGFFERTFAGPDFVDGKHLDKG